MNAIRDGMQGDPGCAHDGIEMRHGLIEGGIVEGPALDRRSEPVETGAFGPVYEIRSYVLKPDGLAPTFEGWAESLPRRTELSRLVVAIYALDGVPRITHIWPYASTDERAAIRADSVKRGVWPPKSRARQARRYCETCARMRLSFDD